MDTASFQRLLPGDYIAGFADGEGCFALKYRKDRQRNPGDGKIREYFYWGVEFAIVLRRDDIKILESIRSTLNCGQISISTKRGVARFAVQGPIDLFKKVIPFFRKYPLRAKKKEDFELWSQAVTIIYNNHSNRINVQKGKRGFVRKIIDQNNADELGSIRDKMLEFKSARSKGFKWGRS